MALRSRDSGMSGPWGGERQVAAGHNASRPLGSPSLPLRPRPRPSPRPVPDLQQRQQQPVEPPPLQQAELRAGAAQLAQEHQQRHLVGGDPVLDAEDVGMDHAVRHHRVEVEALVHARHGGARPPGQPPRRPGNRPRPPANRRRRRHHAGLSAANQRRSCAPPPRGRLAARAQGRRSGERRIRAVPPAGKRANGGGSRAGRSGVRHRGGSTSNCSRSRSARMWTVASYGQHLCGLATARYRPQPSGWSRLLH